MISQGKVRNAVSCVRQVVAGQRISSCFARLAVCAVALSAVANADQIVNGNFSGGNVAFQTDYTLVAANGTVFTGVGDYSLATNPGTQFTNNYNSYTDHTGDVAGLMLFVDGGPSTSNAWAETVSVAPLTTYTFTGWVASADNENLAILGLFVDGSQVGPSVVAPSSPGVWTEWQQAITTSSGQTTLTLAIRDLNTDYAQAGDDFTLDDLSLVGAPATTAPEPSFTFACLAALAAMALLRRGAARGFGSRQ